MSVYTAIQQGTLDEHRRFPATVRHPDGRAPLGIGQFTISTYQDVQYSYESTGPVDNGFVNVVNFGNREAVSRAATYQLAAGLTSGLINRRQSKRAAAMSGYRWVALSSGEVQIGSWGALMRVPGRTFYWPFDSIRNAELIGPGQVLVEADFDNGVNQQLLASEWAEMFFMLWASFQFPEHAQLVRKAWIPPGWHDRARAAGQALPPGS